jgi:hypothetical protein
MTASDHAGHSKMHSGSSTQIYLALGLGGGNALALCIGVMARKRWCCLVRVLVRQRWQPGWYVLWRRL